MARAAATSPRTLPRWFAQVRGETPRDSLHRMRIAKAQALRRTTCLTVDGVAQPSGYGDAGGFGKVFTRVSRVLQVAHLAQAVAGLAERPGTDGPV